MSDRPHRRLSLTRPTAAAPAPEAAPTADTKTAGERSIVRVVAYLTQDEAETLDALWMTLRRRPEKPSKSDLLRAALELAGDDPEALIGALARLADTTHTRRDGKAP